MTEAEQREIAAYVGRHVMGWDPDDMDSWPHGVDEDGCPYAKLPGFFTSASDDYAVLERVRETWDGDRKRLFVSAFQGIVDDQESNTPFWRWIGYRPGDYATAAYRVLKGVGDVE